MAKIGILTYYNVHNHGAVLQANALKVVLESFGHHVSFLQFQRNYDLIPAENARKYQLGLSSIPFYIRYMFQRGLKNIIYNLKKNKILSQYRNANLLLGDRYSDFEGNIAVIGSDEVFSLEVGINPFFFGHGIRTAKVLSYAGCFGPTTKEFVYSHNLAGLIRSGFDNMSAIGVRDINSKTIADSLSKNPSVLVCDPVILYGYEREQRQYVPKDKNYIVIYSYDKNMNDPTEVKQIREYASKYALRIYSVGYYHKWCDKNINVTPEQLLGYIRNASIVITDTFHGSVISLVCNAPFVVKLRGNQNKLGSLMSEYQLSHRIIDNFAQLGDVAAKTIDYDAVNEIIVKRRSASKQFLLNAIGESL